MAPLTRPHSRLLFVLVIGWASAAVGGIVALNRYKFEPGVPASSKVAEQWPAASTLSLAADRPTLLVLLHPHCPCTRATFTELQKLLTHHRGQLATQLLFVQPEGEPASFVEGELWTRAETLLDAQRVIDREGLEAKRLGATTSGTAMLYAPDGKLLFRGGLTVARGHEGDSPGVERITALLANQPALATAPVFGCGLETPPGGI